MKIPNLGNAMLKKPARSKQRWRKKPKLKYYHLNRHKLVTTKENADIFVQAREKQ